MKKVVESIRIFCSNKHSTRLYIPSAVKMLKLSFLDNLSLANSSSNVKEYFFNNERYETLTNF